MERDPTTQRITGLEARIAKYELELDAASTAEEKQRISGLIKSRTETLNNLLINERKALPQDANPSFSSVFNAQFDVFGHGIGLAQFLVGVISVGTVIAGGGFYVGKHHQRATGKFFNSLLTISDNRLSNIPSVLSRSQMVGVDQQPIQKLNLHGAYKSVALIGPNRLGKTIFLSNAILNDMFPWWYRYCFPPRGLFLTGSQKAPNIDAWLKNQIATTEKDDPFAALADLLSQRRQEQRVRGFLFRMFRFSLPAFLLPQPAIIVVDQAEELLRAYRADFLVGFYNLIKEGRDDRLFRLVLVINSDNAVKALELMNGGNMFSIIQAPKVSREAIVGKYGEDFAKIFDECDGCIGVALDYLSDEKRPKDMPAKEYAALKKEKYISDNCLTDEITREEYNKAREHSRK